MYNITVFLFIIHTIKLSNYSCYPDKQEINVIALNLAFLVVGVVIVEVVFVYPGLGLLMVDSVSKRDIPVVQACSMIFASVYILLNLLADIISIVTNPRILHPR